jgi:hypothetical protein
MAFVSINQTSTKNGSISAPERHYALATRVEIWLGEEDETSSTTFSAIEK